MLIVVLAYIPVCLKGFFRVMFLALCSSCTSDVWPRIINNMLAYVDNIPMLIFLLQQATKESLKLLDGTLDSKLTTFTCIICNLGIWAGQFHLSSASLASARKFMKIAALLADASYLSFCHILSIALCGYPLQNHTAWSFFLSRYNSPFCLRFRHWAS